MTLPLRSGSGADGAMHVATVKRSTSLRMKKRGKVPPRLEALNGALALLFLGRHC